MTSLIFPPMFWVVSFLDWCLCLQCAWWPGRFLVVWIGLLRNLPASISADSRVNSKFSLIRVPFHFGLTELCSLLVVLGNISTFLLRVLLAVVSPLMLIKLLVPIETTITVFPSNEVVGSLCWTECCWLFHFHCSVCWVSALIWCSHKGASQFDFFKNWVRVTFPMLVVARVLENIISFAQICFLISFSPIYEICRYSQIFLSAICDVFFLGFV